MSTTKTVFTLRMNNKTLEKIKYIAKVSNRSTSMQIQHVLEKYIEDYEKINGKIDITKIKQ